MNQGKFIYSMFQFKTEFFNWNDFTEFTWIKNKGIYRFFIEEDFIFYCVRIVQLKDVHVMNYKNIY